MTDRVGQSMTDFSAQQNKRLKEPVEYRDGAEGHGRSPPMTGPSDTRSDDDTVRAQGRPGYGPVRVHMTLIAEFWNAYIRAKALAKGVPMEDPQPGKLPSRVTAQPLEADDVPALMQLLKIARKCTGVYNPDNQTDVTGWGNLDTWLNEPNKAPAGLRDEV